MNLFVILSRCTTSIYDAFNLGAQALQFLVTTGMNEDKGRINIRPPEKCTCFTDNLEHTINGCRHGAGWWCSGRADVSRWEKTYLDHLSAMYKLTLQTKVPKRTRTKLMTRGEG